MNTLISKLFLVPAIWRYSILFAFCLLPAYWVYQNVLQSQNVIILNNEHKLFQLNNQIKQYYRNQKKILGQQQAFNRLDQQLLVFEKTLDDFNKNAPERAVLDLVVKSKIKAEEIKVSEREQDAFGTYYRVNLKLSGDQNKVSEFFGQLLRHEELAIWEKLEFQQLYDQLTLSLVSRHYFEIADDVHE